jgi:hypothetical protein
MDGEEESRRWEGEREERRGEERRGEERRGEEMGKERRVARNQQQTFASFKSRRSFSSEVLSPASAEDLFAASLVFISMMAALSRKISSEVILFFFFLNAISSSFNGRRSPMPRAAQ